MTIKEFISAFDLIVPQGVCFGDDNVGLHVGNEKAKLTGVMIAHEMNPKIVDEAAQKKCNLIVCYHPLVFDPLKRVVAGDKTGNIILKFAEKKIALFIAHTNFDSVKNGTNFLLAEKLGLKDCDFLLPMERSLVKVAVFTPQESVEIISRAMWDAGAGTIGEYGDCSFRTEGTGTFLGSESSHPAKGRKSKLEKVEEVRIEMVVPRWRLNDVLQVMRGAHPYEEVAYDIFPLENKGVNYGMGAVGDLPSSVTLGAFIRTVKKVCGIPAVRAVGDLRAKIKRVAVVGGSGGSFLSDAIRSSADAFVTGDVRYHTFRAAEGRIALIDAGHAETERFVADGLTAVVRRVLDSQNYSHICVVKSTKTSEQITYA